MQVLKSAEGSFDHSFKPAVIPNNGGSYAYDEISGDAKPEENPSISILDISIVMDLNIISRTILNYEAIGNKYGGTASDGVDVLTW